MESASSLDTHVEAFAELMARLDAPFADRAAVLREAGLDQAACSALQARYAARFSADGPDAADLARRFGDAYERAREAPAPRPHVSAAQEEEAPSVLIDSSHAAQGSPSGAQAPIALEMPPSSAVAPGVAPPLSVPSFLRDRPGAASPSVPPVIAAPPAGYGSTGPVDLSAALKKAVPFDPAATPALAPPEPALPSPGKTPLSGDTADVDVAAITRRVLAFGAPPKPDAPRPPPSLTVDQYALLSAEIVLAGDDPSARAAVLGRFGVENADALTAEWRARFTADPVLSGRWSAMYAQHYARLRAERPAKR